MLYVLYGDDEFSIYQTLAEIKKGIGDQTALVTNTTVFEGSRVTVDQLKAVCGAMPFLAEKRLVIVYGLLGRFDARRKPGRQKPVVPARQDEPKPLAEYLGSIPDTTVLVLIDGRINSKNPLLGKLPAHARVTNFPTLRGDKLRLWVQRRVREKSGRISAPAVSLLARFVGGNLWIMASEIDKLVLFASGRGIEEADIRLVVSYSREADVFAMVDAILDFRAGTAESLLQQLLQQGAAPTYLLAMLTRQVRLIVQVKELVRKRKSQREMMERMELNKEFVLQKALEQAGRYSLARLKEVYHKLLEADLSIKTGKYDHELALNILVAELGQRQKLEVA